MGLLGNVLGFCLSLIVGAFTILLLSGFVVAGLLLLMIFITILYAFLEIIWSMIKDVFNPIWTGMRRLWRKIVK